MTLYSTHDSEEVQGLSAQSQQSMKEAYQKHVLYTALQELRKSFHMTVKCVELAKAVSLSQSNNMRLFGYLTLSIEASC